MAEEELGQPEKTSSKRRDVARRGRPRIVGKVGAGLSEATAEARRSARLHRLGARRRAASAGLWGTSP